MRLLLARGALLIGILMLAGCGTSKVNQSGGNAHVSETYGFWQPYLLYLQASPHARMYVEVDAVEGCEPSDATLAKLRTFLAAYCNKPGGIEIVRSDVIRVNAARGIGRKALAYRFFKGPPDSARGEAPAVMYLLFYDGALCDERTSSKGHQGESRRKSPESERDMVPHVELLPYPAIIFINTRYGSRMAGREYPFEKRDDALLHEAGHLLGLSRRLTGAATNHCLATSCLMTSAIYMHYSRAFLGRNPMKPHRLCESCVAELTASAASRSTTNLHFVGPVLVRSEDGYHVLSLPSRVKVIVGKLIEQDCHDFVSAFRAEAPPPKMSEYRADGWMKPAMLRDAAKSREIINRAKADPFAPVRTVASRLESALEAPTEQ